MQKKCEKNAKKKRPNQSSKNKKQKKREKKGKKKGLTTEPPGGTSKNCSTPVSKADLKFLNSLARQDFFLGVLPGELKNFRTALETGVLQFLKVRKN